MAIIFLLLFNTVSISEDLLYSFILFLTVLHLHCCSGFSLVRSGDYSPAVVHELLRAEASLAVVHGLQGVQVSGAAAREFSSSIVVVHGLRCFKVRRILSDQGVNPRLLHSQAGSLPLSHQGSPRMFFYSASVLRVSALCQLLPGAAGTECERDAPSWEEFWPGPAEETGDAHTAAP